MEKQGLRTSNSLAILSNVTESLLTMGLCERGDDLNNGIKLLRISQN